LIHQERGPCVRATLDENESLARVEFVVRERELIVGFILGLDRRE
jgi:hypothetical protein